MKYLYSPFIMKPSLWDLKPVIPSCSATLTENHEAIPMGFETTSTSRTILQMCRIMKPSLWDLKHPYGIDNKSPKGIMKPSLWDLKHGNAIDDATFAALIMKPSLWDLKHEKITPRAGEYPS